MGNKELSIIDIYNKCIYYKEQNNIKEYDIYYDLLKKTFNDTVIIEDKNMLVNIKFLIDPMSLNTEEKEFYMNMNKDINFLIKFIYNNFKEDFQNGDIIITGSIVYDKIGLFHKKGESKDLDLSIIYGDKGDEILNKIYELFDNDKKGFITKYIKPNQNNYNKNNDVYNLLANPTACICVSKYGTIDILRGEHNNKKNESIVELLPNIYTKYYGDEWIMKILYNNVCNIKSFLINYSSTHMENQMIKFTNMLKEMYKNTKIVFEDKDFENKIKLLD